MLIKKEVIKTKVIKKCGWTQYIINTWCTNSM